ncbi:hypothetical protein DFR60_1287 [Hungatella effluvii]|uniref:Uncharacterized protein n=1 Tax=Hungatella effluvii TaxID=1096246 RepID=A0A2V3XX18_9FIRM|nr:hypothetical protein [Hungatella effluvii]PXX44285.1 hypothetical protein DFR60_1287 [Hungatella effluvii]
MKWQECFQKYKYTELIDMDKDGERKTKLDFFCVEGKVPDELRQIYLSECGDELFLILRLSDVENMERFCNLWDNKILTFINFTPKQFREEIRKLQYNITQILLYEGAVEKKMEKSVSVSRKIFVKCNEDDELDDNDKMLLPFWFGDLESAEINKEERQKLENLLPSAEVLGFMYKKREKQRRQKTGENKYNFQENEWLAMEGWLKENVAERN